MPTLEHLIPFVVATAVFAYVPGPAILYTAAQTLSRGRAAGFMAALGIHIGGYVHVLAAAFGLSVVFRHVPEAYAILKLIGAVYLVWLGIRLIRTKMSADDLPVLGRKSARRAFIESAAVEVLNPKVAVFYIAFLPQFVDSSAALPISLQFLILGTIVNIAFSSADLIVVLLTDRIVSGVKRSALGERLARYMGGSIMVALGIRLAFTRD